MTRRNALHARSPELPIAIGDAETNGAPLHRAVYDALRTSILEGRLRPGARLPSTRALAVQLDVARGTVVAAFDQLTAEGYIRGRVGSGTIVTTELPDLRFITAPGKPKLVRRRARGADLPASRVRSAIADPPFPIAPRRAPRPFRPHVPALDAFPIELWARLVGRRARDERLLFADGDPRGYRPLREAIAEHVRVARGVTCSAEQVVITPSVQQTLDLIARIVLEPGDRVWLEDPGYTGASAVLRSAGASIVHVPVDDHGINVAYGVARAADARLAYVTPSHQAPLGVTMPIERRLALLAWAEANGAWILEDDYDSEFRYEGRPLPSMQGLDRAGIVIHAGSFSKTLVPSIRLGYAVLPEPLLDPFVAAKSIVDRFTPPLLQAALADFIAEGHFARHLRRMRELYAERRTALLRAIEEELGGALDVIGAEAGLDLSAWLPVGVDDRAIEHALDDAGIEAVALSRQTSLAGRRGGLLLGFAAFSPARLRRSVAAMRTVLARHRSHAARRRME